MQIHLSADTYTARGDDGKVLWRRELRLDMSATPFRDEIVWPAASAVVIAGGHEVHFLAMSSGALLKTLSLGEDFYGHLGPTELDTLYVLGWWNVTAVDSSLDVRWVSKDVAIDGISWRGLEGDRVFLLAEMDPPGGWVDVELDVHTGRELARERS